MSAKRESPRSVNTYLASSYGKTLLTFFPKLFAALSETLHNQVRIVAAEKNEMTSEAQRIITTIKQMDVSINGAKDRHEYEAEDEDLKITTPLIPCLQYLKEKHTQISRIHKERFEQVKSQYPWVEDSIV